MIGPERERGQIELWCKPGGGGLCCHPTLMLSQSPPDGHREGKGSKTHTHAHTQVSEWTARNLHQKEKPCRAKECGAQSSVNLCPWSGACGLFGQQISLAPVPTALPYSQLHVPSLSQQGHMQCHLEPEGDLLSYANKPSLHLYWFFKKRPWFNVSKLANHRAQWCLCGSMDRMVARLEAGTIFLMSC